MVGTFQPGVWTGPRNIHRGPRSKKRKRTTIRELAEFFQCARKTVYRRIKISPTPVDLYDIQSVYHFIAQQTITMVLVKR